MTHWFNRHVNLLDYWKKKCSYYFKYLKVYYVFQTNTVVLTIALIANYYFKELFHILCKKKL